MIEITEKLKEEFVKLSKLLGTLSIAGSITAGLICSTSCSDKRNLTEEDFKYATWYATYNFNHPILDYFNEEDVYPSLENRTLYERLVKEKNNGRSKGWIGVPDLDRDGWVGTNRLTKEQPYPRP